jgi:NDP-mannose synthase
MEAVILAGGKGTRLHPFTTVLPKPLMPVGGRPILGIIIDQLKQAGVTRITLAVNYMAEIIMAMLGDGEKYGLKIEYSIEPFSLSTIGPLKLIQDLPQEFILMNGDILTNLDYNDLYSIHRESGCQLTISVYRREEKIDFGILRIDREKNRIVGFQEKPVYHFDVSTGIYVMNRSLLDQVPVGIPYGMDNLITDLLERREPIHPYLFSGYWLDIGRPDDYERANLEIESLGLAPRL